MSILRDMSGEFTVVVDGETKQYDNFNDIPAEIDTVQSFKPNYPPEPHTISEHAELALWNEDMTSLMQRSSGGPPATRIGDKDVPHCSGMVRAEGSENVFVNGIPWSLQGHVNTPHLIPSGDDCDIHVAPIATGSPTVIVNGVGAGRVGDSISGCTQVAEGSPNVFCGP